ncbi:hypothetical protein CSW98_06505 [Vibrio sp. HA2012]|uniref:hypothetical protein n=1 Tax=Vibrio sp. HA2012 TaxID=1971595 RepID=UPI000C2C73CC|nr:hypothetical protein [Vibrio sp. HA2012]PJC86644.1 hypothetical protein CSW98_06505 [Vibrio sp. HA2012]
MFKFLILSGIVSFVSILICIWIDTPMADTIGGYICLFVLLIFGPIFGFFYLKEKIEGLSPLWKKLKKGHRNNKSDKFQHEKEEPEKEENYAKAAWRIGKDAKETSDMHDLLDDIYPD